MQPELPVLHRVRIVGTGLILLVSSNNMSNLGSCVIETNALLYFAANLQQFLVVRVGTLVEKGKFRFLFAHYL